MKKGFVPALAILAGFFVSAFFDFGVSGFGTGGRPGKATLDLDFRVSLDTRVTLTRATVASCFNRTGVLVEFASGAARLPCFTYDGADWINRGLLSEEARTNISLQSEALGTTWTVPGANTTITDNAGLAVDGATTAEDVLHLDNAETIQQTITVTDNTVVAISAFVKQGTTGSHDFVKMSWLDESDGDNGFEAWYDITDCTVGTAQAQGTGSYTGGSATATDVSNGWCRISAVGQVVSGQTDGRFEISNTTADATDTAEATNSVFWWGLQVTETASTTTYALSYIATTTGAVARNADVTTMTVSAFFNDSAGTLYIEAFSPNDGNTFDRLAQFDDGGASDRIELQRDATNARAFIITAFGTEANMTASTWANATSAKLAIAWVEDDIAFVSDGGTVATDSNATLPGGISRLQIGHDHADGAYLNGYIAQIKYWNQRLPNAQLQDITQ